LANEWRLPKRINGGLLQERILELHLGKKLLNANLQCDVC
jgi:hypothetical protein